MANRFPLIVDSVNLNIKELPSGDNLDLTGSDALFGDNDKAIFGTGSDLQIYHDALNSYIDEVGTGNLLVRADSLQLRRADGSQLYLAANTGAEVALYHAGNSKLSTTATGIDVTGTVTADGLTVANTAVIAGDFDGGTAATYIRLQDDTDNFLFGSNNSLGNFLIKNETADALRLSVANTGDISFYEDTGTTAKFFWDASAERLGIGTSSPTDTLSVGTLGSGGNSIITIGASTSGTSSVYFGDGASAERFRGYFDYVHSSDHLAIGTAAVERMRIDSSGNVAIGQQSNTGGSVKLDLHNSGNGVGTQIAFYNDHNTGGHFIGQAGNTTGNIIYYNVANTNQEFYNNNDLKMTLDASGNLLVGTTDRLVADGTGTGLVLGGQSDLLHASRHQGDCAKFNRTGNDGNVVTFAKDGTAVGSIGTVSGYLYVGGTAGNESFLSFGADGVRPSTSAGAARDAAIDLGGSTNRFKDLFLSGGVYLGGTGSANKLDDYEEGTWDPEFGGEGSDPTVVYNTQKGSYTKVGNLVTVTGQIITTSRSGGSGNLTIKNLPFTTQSGEAPFSGVIGFNFNWVSGEQPNGAVATQGTTKLFLYKDTSTNTHNEVDDILASGNSYLYFNLTYFTA